MRVPRTCSLFKLNCPVGNRFATAPSCQWAEENHREVEGKGKGGKPVDSSSPSHGQFSPSRYLRETNGRETFQRLLLALPPRVFTRHETEREREREREIRLRRDFAQRGGGGRVVATGSKIKYPRASLHADSRNLWISKFLSCEREFSILCVASLEIRGKFVDVRGIL